MQRRELRTEHRVSLLRKSNRAFLQVQICTLYFITEVETWTQPIRARI